MRELWLGKDKARGRWDPEAGKQKQANCRRGSFHWRCLWKDDVLACTGMSPGFELVGVEGMDPGRDQSLFNGSRQILREGMGLGRARRQRPPGNQIGSGFRVTFPEIQKRNKGHGLFLFPFQHSKCHMHRHPAEAKM